jgi:hypothetical protein
MQLLAPEHSTDQRTIFAARSRMDALLAAPSVEQTVLIRPEPAFVRDAIIELREARGRLAGRPAAQPLAVAGSHVRAERDDPIAEFVLTHTSVIDLRDKSSAQDQQLRTARLAARAAAILDEIARERAASDARLGPPRAMIPSEDWSQPPGRRPVVDLCATARL